MKFGKNLREGRVWWLKEGFGDSLRSVFTRYGSIEAAFCLPPPTIASPSLSLLRKLRRKLWISRSRSPGGIIVNKLKFKPLRFIQLESVLFFCWEEEEKKELFFRLKGESMATTSGGGSGGGGGIKEGSAKATVADQICQAVQSTSNLLHLMQQSSPSQVAPKSLFPFCQDLSCTLFFEFMSRFLCMWGWWFELTNLMAL